MTDYALRIRNTLGIVEGMDLSERIGTLRQVNNLSARQLADLAGVAPSTITRIEAGTMQPAFDLGASLLALLGEPIMAVASADADAILAVRRAFDSTFPARVTSGSERWAERWSRIGLVDGSGRVIPGREADLLFRAATVSRLARRSGVVDLAPSGDWVDVAQALSNSDVDWSLTGDAAANYYLPSATETWPVFYVSSLEDAIQAAGLVRRSAPSGRRITLIPFDGVCEVDKIEDDGLWVADRVQVALDCYGGISRMREQADAMMGVRM